MSNRRANKRNLSKGILDMKFMKKSKEKLEKEIEDEEGADFFGTDNSKTATSDGAQFIIEHSMVPIERLVNGRMSFKGMNPEIERLMKQEWQDIEEEHKALERSKSNQPEISDQDMARHLGKTIARKFKTKKGNRNNDESEEDTDESNSAEKSPPKKAKFMKPTDD